MFEEVKKYVDKMVSEKELPYVGVIVYKEHEELYSYFNGRKAPVGRDNLLTLYSCTKPVTVVSAMQLVEAGRLSLDDEVGRYIPAFYDAYTLDESNNKVPLKSPILIRHLFTMSAGIDYASNKAPITEFIKNNPRATTAEVVSTFVKSPLHFEPGTRFMYSYCHDVLGAVIEVISGKTLAEYMKENIFIPLGMKNTSMEAMNYYEKPPVSYVWKDGYVDDGGEAFRRFILTERYYSGGAGLVGTAEDYALFADALASGGVGKNGNRIIGEEAIRQIGKVQIENIDVQNSFTCVQGADYGYGLGVRVRTKPHECGIPVGEFGWDGAAGTYLLADRENKISIVIGLNILRWPERVKGDHLAIADRVYREVLKNGN